MSPANPDTSTFAVPRIQADRLRKLAEITNRKSGHILAELIDDACLAAGMDISSSAVRVSWRREAKTFKVSLFGGTREYVMEMPRACVETLANALQEAADNGRSCTNLDDVYFDVKRQGTGVVLKASTMVISGSETSVKHVQLTTRSMTPQFAREMAEGLRQGLADHA